MCVVYLRTSSTQRNEFDSEVAAPWKHDLHRCRALGRYNRIVFMIKSTPLYKFYRARQFILSTEQPCASNLQHDRRPSTCRICTISLKMNLTKISFFLSPSHRCLRFKCVRKEIVYFPAEGATGAVG